MVLVGSEQPRAVWDYAASAMTHRRPEGIQVDLYSLGRTNPLREDSPHHTISGRRPFH